MTRYLMKLVSKISWFLRGQNWLRFDTLDVFISRRKQITPVIIDSEVWWWKFTRYVLKLMRLASYLKTIAICRDILTEYEVGTSFWVQIVFSSINLFFIKKQLLLVLAVLLNYLACTSYWSSFQFISFITHHACVHGYHSL